MHRPLLTLRSLLPLAMLALLANSAVAEQSPAPASDTPNPAVATAPTAEDAKAMRERARALWEDGQKEAAIAVLDEAIKRFPEDANNYWQRGYWFGGLKRHAEAIADLRRVTELKPKFDSAWGSLGRYLILQGDFPEAQTASAQAQSLDPESYAWTINLGHAYLLQGDRDSAHQWYERTIPLIPDEAALRRALAHFDLFIERGWQVEAAREERAWLEAAALTSIQAKDRQAEAYALADRYWSEGRKLQDQGESLAAAQAYLRAAEAEKTSGQPRMRNLSVCLGWAAAMYEAAAHYGEAEPLYREALAIRREALPEGHPKIAPPINNLAALLRTTGRYAEAEPLHREALAIWREALPKGHPRIALSLNNLAALLETTGRYAEAEPLYREALAIKREALPGGHTDIALSLNNLAALLETTGRYAEAEPLYREALAIKRDALPEGHTDIALSLNNLAGLLKTTGRYAEAEPLYREALAMRREALPEGHPDIAQSLNNLAGLLRTTGRYAEAEPLYREALAIWRKGLPEGHPTIATSLNSLAALLETTGRYAEAEPLYREALAIKRDALPEGHTGIATSLNNLAGLLKTTGRYAEAEPLYREALAMRREALPEGHPDIATSLNNLAGLLDTTGRYAEAEPLYREALAIDREALPEGHPTIATSLNNLAALLDTTGRYAEAEPLYREALAIRREALPEGHPTIATSLNNLAVLLETTGRYAEAEPLLREALAMRREALPEGHPDIATSLNNLARLLDNTGRYAEAEPLYRDALAMRREALPEGHPDIAQSLNNLAALLETTGRYAEAEPLLREALAMRREALPEGHPEIATSLHSLAALLETTGRYAEAEPLLREALAIFRKALPEGHSTIATSLNNLAVLLNNTGRYAEAEPLYREALAMRREALPEGHPDIAQSGNNLAFLLDTTGRYAEAEPLYREALAIWRAALPDGHPSIAYALKNLGLLLSKTDRASEAEPLLLEALRISQSGGAPRLLWKVQGNLADFYTDQAQRPLGIFFGKQAVNTLQSVRQELSQSEQTTQQAFLQSKESYYKDLAEWLIAEGRLPESQQVLAMLKEQEFHDFLRGDADDDPRQTQADYNAFEAEQLAAYEADSRALVALGAEYRELAEIDPFALTPAQEARLAELETALAEAYRRFDQAVAGIKAAFATLSDARREELAKRQMVQGKDERGLVRDLGEDVALLQVLVMPERVHLLLTLPEVMLARQAEVGEEALNAQVQQLRQALQDPTRDPRPAARVLYDALIAPVATELEAAGIKTLMVGLDGVLRYVPLAALHDGEGYLVERYALSVFTEIGRENLKLPPTGEWSGIGLGVSLPHEAVGPTRARFGALPTVPEELEGIIRRAQGEDADGVLAGRYFLDADFTASTLRKALRFPVLHLATHFSLQPGNEAQSFLLLGDGEALQLRQIREDNYDFGRIDLLTLSACETAVGGQNAQGQEVEGLGALAQLQGAKAVIATLWPVADASTGLFMQHFYQLRQEQDLTKAEALRQAQLGFLHGTAVDGDDGATEAATGGATDVAETARKPVALAAADPDSDQAPDFTPDPDHPYAHPFYWAPFILMGNWL